MPLQALLPLEGMASLGYKDELPEIAACLEYVINTISCTSGGGVDPIAGSAS